jgi:hypothetical protein
MRGLDMAYVKKVGQFNETEARSLLKNGRELQPDAPSMRYYVVLFQTGEDEDNLGDLDRFVFDFLQAQLHEKIFSASSETEIDVWLDSPGGSAGIAYKLLLALRHRCKTLRIVIPDYAKSAATLLAIGGDEIYMAPAAELGPLDAQSEHPAREGLAVSALDLAKAYEFLSEFSVNFAISGARIVFERIKLARMDALRESFQFTARLLEPSVAKLDPHLIHSATNQLDLAHRYAEIVLKTRRLSKADKADGFDPEVFSDLLVRHYPAHEFVISRDEARGLGIPVKDAELYDKWSLVYPLHRYFRDEGFSGSPQSILEFWTEQELQERIVDTDREDSRIQIRKRRNKKRKASK